jgi:hypothetical protein
VRETSRRARPCLPASMRAARRSRARRTRRWRPPEGDRVAFADHGLDEGD